MSSTDEFIALLQFSFLASCGTLLIITVFGSIRQKVSDGVAMCVLTYSSIYFYHTGYIDGNDQGYIDGKKDAEPVQLDRKNYGLIYPNADGGITFYGRDFGCDGCSNVPISDDSIKTYCAELHRRMDAK